MPEQETDKQKIVTIEPHACRKKETGKCCGNCSKPVKKIRKSHILDAGLVDYD